MPTIVTAGAATAGAYGWSINGPNPYLYDVLLVAGGGGGGFNRGGGGGAGGVAYYANQPTNHGSTFSYSVGTGGAGATGGAVRGTNGGDTTYGALTVLGGGGGGTAALTLVKGLSGGSGGGTSSGNTAVIIAQFTASTSGTVMTVTAMTSGTIVPGDFLDTAVAPIYNPNTIQERTYVVSQISGTTGGIGTYNISLANTIGSGTFYTVVDGGAGTVGQGNNGGYGSYPLTSISSASGGGGASSVGVRGFRGLYGHYSTGGSGLITSIHPLFCAFGGGGGGGGYSLGITAASGGYGGIGGGGWGGAPANVSFSGGTASQSGTTLTVTAAGLSGAVGTVTGSITGTTLTITATGTMTPQAIIGMTVTGTGVASGTVITGIITGAGTSYPNTYSLNKSSTVASSTLTLGWGGFLPGSGWLGSTITAETVVGQLTATNAAACSTTATGTNGANYITVASTAGLTPGMFVQAISGVPTGTYVNAISGTTVELTNLLTGNLSSAAINFYPAGFEGTYQMSVSQTGASQTMTNNTGQPVKGTNGLQYTGGGAGGGGGNSGLGGRGGDGCVIIRYASAFTQPTITGSYSSVTSGIYTIYLLTGSGTVKWNQ